MARRVEFDQVQTRVVAGKQQGTDRTVDMAIDHDFTLAGLIVP